MSEIWHETATGAIALVVGLLAWIVRRELGRIEEDRDEQQLEIDCHRRKLAEIPVKFIGKADCDRLHEQAHNEVSAMVTEVRDGFARINARLDDMTKLSNERHQKLSDQITELWKAKA